jgi:hypothetical protein
MTGSCSDLPANWVELDKLRAYQEKCRVELHLRDLRKSQKPLQSLRIDDGVVY